MGFYRGPKIVTNGLVLALDAGNIKSYPGSGTNWVDLSGNGNNGTLTNGPTFDNGSFLMDATNDIITVADNNSIDSTELTTSLWFNRGDILPLSFGDQEVFFIKGNGGNAPGGDQLCPAITLRGPIGGGTYIWSYLANGLGYAVLTPPSQIFFANQWYNITITHISTQQPIPYLNGVKQTDWVGTNVTNPLVPNTWPLSFAGDVNRDTSSRYAKFNGKFAIFQMYNRALSEDEVIQNWNATKGRFNL